MKRLKSDTTDMLIMVKVPGFAICFVKQLGKKEIEHIDTIEKDGRLYYSYKVLRTKKIASAIIQNQIDDIGRIKEETREVNLNGDDKRFWLNRLTDINDRKSNSSMPLTPQQFPERFKLNED